MLMTVKAIDMQGHGRGQRGCWINEDTFNINFDVHRGDGLDKICILGPGAQHLPTLIGMEQLLALQTVLC